MGVILAKFRKDKSTESVLEALQEKINTLEKFTVNTQEQKKRIVGNFLAASIGVYVIAFLVFYFVYFPPTWKERIVYCIPLLLFPLIIILLRYLFTWYFQRKLNKNSKKLAALRAEKKKILEQVMDKETYKVAVNLLARYGEKQSKPSFALSPASTAAVKSSTHLFTQRTQQSTLTASPQFKTTSSPLGTPKPPLIPKTVTSSPASTALMVRNSGFDQQLRRRTPFPIVNQQEKGVFDRIVDVLIGDGLQNRFAMICKECYSHNGMALKDDFEYTTFRCVFCSALNPARKIRPVAPRLVVMTAPAGQRDGSDTSHSEDDKDDSDDENYLNSKSNMKQSAITKEASATKVNDQNIDTPPVESLSSLSDTDEEKNKAKISTQSEEVNGDAKEDLRKKENSALNQLENPDSAIEDTNMTSE